MLKGKLWQTGLSLVLLCLFSFFIVRPGLLQPLELSAFDFLLEHHTQTNPIQHVLVIGETEEDLHRFGHPLPDGFFGEIAHRLQEAGAAGIGFDKLRDFPVPHGTDFFHETILANPNIIWVFEQGGKVDAAIPAPAVLKNTNQTGFSDLLQDPDSSIRRGLLLMNNGKKNLYSFPLMLSLNYLYDQHKITMTATPGHPGEFSLDGHNLTPISSTSGGYSHIGAQGYQILLQYFGAPNLIQTRTLSDLIDGKISNEEIRNKVVLVGGRAESLKDYKQIPVPVLGAPIQGISNIVFGVDVHAFIINQLINTGLGNTNNINYISEAIEYSWVFTCFFLGFLISLISNRIYLAGSIVIITSSIIYSSWLAFEYGWWLISVTPFIAYAIGLGFNLTYTLIIEKKERKSLMSLFSKHVSSGVAELIWEQRESLLEGQTIKPRTMYTTVMFTDIKGFTSISEGQEPSELLSWLNEYMAVMTDLIEEHHGFLNSYIGDGIMAVFGAPVASETESQQRQDAINSANCAHAMGNALNQLNEKWKKENKPVIEIRAGMFSGAVVTGSMGSKDRSDYCIIGDTVNTAARLEAWGSKLDDNEDNIKVTVGESTAKYLNEDFHLVPVGALKLKGKEDKVQAFQVIIKKT